jgi:hypothetical protein
MMPLLMYLGVGSTPWSPMAKGRECLWPVERRPAYNSRNHRPHSPSRRRLQLCSLGECEPLGVPLR